MFFLNQRSLSLCFFFLYKTSSVLILFNKCLKTKEMGACRFSKLCLQIHQVTFLKLFTLLVLKIHKIVFEREFHRCFEKQTSEMRLSECDSIVRCLNCFLPEIIWRKISSIVFFFSCGHSFHASMFLLLGFVSAVYCSVRSCLKQLRIIFSTFKFFSDSSEKKITAFVTQQ